MMRRVCRHPVETAAFEVTRLFAASLPRRERKKKTVETTAGSRWSASEFVLHACRGTFWCGAPGAEAGLTLLLYIHITQINLSIPSLMNPLI